MLLGQLCYMVFYGITLIITVIDLQFQVCQIWARELQDHKEQI